MPIKPVPSTVQCPTCSASSGNIERQSLGKKAAKFGAFGVFAIASATKTFKCLSCGYVW
jgi:rubredoxin